MNISKLIEHERLTPGKRKLQRNRI